jgi:hypothetical protein
VAPVEESSIVNEAGSGVAGLVDGVQVAVGNREWVLRHCPGEVLSEEAPVRPNKEFSAYQPVSHATFGTMQIDVSSFSLRFVCRQASLMRWCLPAPKPGGKSCQGDQVERVHVW